MNHNFDDALGHCIVLDCISDDASLSVWTWTGFSKIIVLKYLQFLIHYIFQYLWPVVTPAISESCVMLGHVIYSQNDFFHRTEKKI